MHLSVIKIDSDSDLYLLLVKSIWMTPNQLNDQALRTLIPGGLFKGRPEKLFPYPEELTVFRFLGQRRLKPIWVNAMACRERGVHGNDSSYLPVNMDR